MALSVPQNTYQSLLSIGKGTEVFVQSNEKLCSWRASRKTDGTHLKFLLRFDACCSLTLLFTLVHCSGSGYWLYVGLFSGSDQYYGFRCLHTRLHIFLSLLCLSLFIFFEGFSPCFLNRHLFFNTFRELPSLWEEATVTSHMYSSRFLSKSIRI